MKLFIYKSKAWEGSHLILSGEAARFWEKGFILERLNTLYDRFEVDVSFGCPSAPFLWLAKYLKDNPDVLDLRLEIPGVLVHLDKRLFGSFDGKTLMEIFAPKPGEPDSYPAGLQV